MKKHIGMVGSVLLLLSGGALAEGYLGVAVGQGRQSVECPAGVSCKVTDTAYKLVGGYVFGKVVGVEAGFLDFGKAKATASSLNSEVNVSALMLGGVARAHFTSDFAALLRLGVASVKAERKVYGLFTDEASESKVKPYFGVGLSYSISRQVAVEVAADFTKAELEGEKANVRALTAGVRLEF